MESICEDMRASGAGLPASAAQAERNAGASLRTSHAPRGRMFASPLLSGFIHCFSELHKVMVAPSLLHECFRVSFAPSESFAKL